MKSGPEIVKAGLRQFFESAADDIEKMVENLKLGKVSSRNQVRDSSTLSRFTLPLPSTGALTPGLVAGVGERRLSEHQLHHHRPAAGPHLTVRPHRPAPVWG